MKREHTYYGVKEVFWTKLKVNEDQLIQAKLLYIYISKSVMLSKSMTNFPKLKEVTYMLCNAGFSFE